MHEDNNTVMDTTTSPAAPVWSALTSKQRRVLGSLMEKSKTTPDVYPMSFAALTTACNQKTNREPISHYTTEIVERTVEELKKLGAVTLVHGNGRVEKVRHYAYQWFGLSKVEAAVMTELLLRGHQTLGDLRARASRLEPIADQGELQTLIEALAARNLIVKLTPPGRGQIVSHNVYEEWELEELQKAVVSGTGRDISDEDDQPYHDTRAIRSDATAKNVASSDEIAELRNIITKLCARVEHLERELGVTPPEA
jgi:uncharacterized protein